MTLNDILNMEFLQNLDLCWAILFNAGIKCNVLLQDKKNPLFPESHNISLHCSQFF